MLEVKIFGCLFFVLGIEKGLLSVPIWQGGFQLCDYITTETSIRDLGDKIANIFDIYNYIIYVVYTKYLVDAISNTLYIISTNPTRCQPHTPKPAEP